MHKANIKIFSTTLSKCLLKYWLFPFFHVNLLETIKLKAVKKQNSS